MFRGFLAPIIHMRVSKSCSSALTTLAVEHSLPRYLKPTLFNKTQVIDNRPHVSSFQCLVDQYKNNLVEVNNSPSPSYFVWNEGFEMAEYLVERYQGSCCPDEVKQLQLQVTKHGLASDIYLSNTLINVFVRVGDLVSARKVFDEMHQRNTVTWTCLISGYTRNCRPNEAFALFKHMFYEGIFPNHYAFGSVLRACQERGLEGLNLGMQIHGIISKSCYACDLVVSNVLISLYGSFSGFIEHARRVFDETLNRNSVTWNSIISVYSQRGDVLSAFDLFSQMQRGESGFRLKPNEYTFGSLITVAWSSFDSGLCLLEQMLTSVTKSGFMADLYVGSALVSGFARSGLIDNARKIFEYMDQRNAVSMNGLMVGLVRQKRGEEAAEFFVQMKSSIDINHDSYVILLSAFPEFSVLEEGRRKGREVHGYVTRLGLTDSVVSMKNGLINMYAKCGGIDEASSVFTLMVNKDSVSWNSMISGLDQNERFLDAVENYCKMRRTGLMPANFTLISTLSSCASLGWINLGQQMHCESFKLGLDLDVSVSNALIALYSENGSLAECQKIFNSMNDHDQVSWNSIIGALSSSEVGPASESIKYFMKMMRNGWNLNKITFMNILTAISSFSLCEFSHQIHALLLKHQVINDTAIENALLSCYGKSGMMQDCEKIFSRMAERRDEVSWNSMVSSYIHNELLPEAMDLVWFMMQRGQKLDAFTFATVLSACASVATLERGMEVHACATRACLECDVVVASALVDMYSKCGRIDNALKFFNTMPLKNMYSWNSMISGYARHGLGDKALDLFEQMKQDGQLPDHVTFVGVLSACSHGGLVEEGFRYFKSMTEVYKLNPRIEHFSCMVDILGRAGEIDKLENFVNTMPLRPNVLIWRTVLGACCRSSNRKNELGRKAAQMLMEMEPENAVNHVLLSNMYAFGGKWEDMAKARKNMREAAVKKEAGCSWVTMKDGVHVFVAADKSHPEKELIYEKLRELHRKIKDAGYIPQTKFALYDLDSETKEELLSLHSEKIAVAFVLTRNSVMPIRIMKNLRVCGDCHLAFKFISKVVGRQIVLRDSNRFHHFDGGECSCRDYW